VYHGVTSDFFANIGRDWQNRETFRTDYICLIAIQIGFGQMIVIAVFDCVQLEFDFTCRCWFVDAVKTKTNNFRLNNKKCFIDCNSYLFRVEVDLPMPVSSLFVLLMNKLSFLFEMIEIEL